jgi:serine-type D-Ala-D-Ala carboxypeptidase/endopeptidase (penicillin-binding protein 4)
MLGASLTLAACSATRRAGTWERTIVDSEVFAKSHTGFYLQDPLTGEVLAAHQADRYFIPASNTKILTLVTCLQVLGDSLPSVEYTRASGMLMFRGTGDPTFLHPQFEAWQAGFEALKCCPSDSLVLVQYPFGATRFGPGWMWDDYNDLYQPERSAMPIYGNCLTRQPNGQVWPALLQRNFTTSSTNRHARPVRDEYDNEWTVGDLYQPDGPEQFPFRTHILADLLRDTLHRGLSVIKMGGSPTLPGSWKVRYSCPVDTVYRQLMHHSDNHFAEQLLLMAAARQSGGYFDQDSIIRYATRQLLPPSATPPVWVDGSGMSRYNMMTPRYYGTVLADMYKKHPKKRLFDLFPAGGMSGTIRTWYNATPGDQPFVYAKTGSMTGVHCLSGYIVCRSGRVLVFSFMHNNFTGSSKPYKQEMQRILNDIRERY